MRLLKKPELTYKNKLIITFVLIAFLPTIFMQYITYWNSTQAMKAKIDELVNYSLIQTDKNLTAVLSDYENVLYQFIMNEEVIRSTKKLLHGSDFDQLVYSDALQSLMTGYTNSKTGIRGFTFFDNNGNILATYDKQAGMLWGTESGVAPYLLIMKLNGMQKGPPLITTTEKGSPNPDNGDTPYMFHIARMMYSISSERLEKLGYMVMTLDEAVLADACSFSLLDEDRDGIGSTNFLIDSGRNLVTFPERSRIGSSVSRIWDANGTGRDGLLPKTASILGQPSILNYYTNTKTGWTIVNVTSEKKMFGEMYAMQKLTVWAGIVIFAVSLLLIVYFSGLLTKSIHTVVKAMKAAENGNLDVTIEDRTGDEIALIASGFNRMMKTIHEWMERTKTALEKQKESEIRSLEAQINPHFLYNTLDSINWMAIDREEHEISRMLKKLAHILRYSISNSNKLVTLAQELDWLEQYLFLQQYRFNGSFNYFVHLDPELAEAKIYKLLLQPFVENTIVHGFAGKKTGAELHIRFTLTCPDTLHVEIEDNGCGMEPAVFSGLLSRESADHEAGGRGIGIRNVLDRLQLYYGDKAGCTIESEIGTGTRVILQIPYS
ncbi:sensor histidine kinase [Paenibacillus chartarius]|uniref:histidine kinase n=1 Tax=Paenibacillus chartarius TaxID=747481 RepID=A0ABV6DT58_9BACL